MSSGLPDRFSLSDFLAGADHDVRDATLSSGFLPGTSKERIAELSKFLEQVDVTMVPRKTVALCTRAAALCDIVESPIYAAAQDLFMQDSHSWTPSHVSLLAWGVAKSGSGNNEFYDTVSLEWKNACLVQ